MELMKAIKERRSVRKFTDKMPTAAELNAVVEAGVWAASGMGKQSSIMIVVTDRALRDEISAENARIMGMDGIDPFYGAPAIIIVAAHKEVPTAVYDGSLSLGNMMLAAHDMGLGTCWIHRAQQEFNGELGKKILAMAGVSGEFEGVGHLAIGYPDGALADPAPRKEGRVFKIGE